MDFRIENWDEVSLSIDPFHIYIQFEAKGVIPCAARSLHRIVILQLHVQKQFHALLRAMHAFEISIHIKSKQVMFPEEFKRSDVIVKGVYFTTRYRNHSNTVRTPGNGGWA